MTEPHETLSMLKTQTAHITVCKDSGTFGVSAREAQFGTYVDQFEEAIQPVSDSWNLSNYNELRGFHCSKSNLL